MPTLVLDPVLDEALAGLLSDRKTLPCKLLYDRRGSQLFDQICELPEYYPTRTESAIMHVHAHRIAEAIGPDAALIELGSGSSTKTRALLDALETPAAYVPIDISEQHLLDTARQLDADYDDLDILPLVADYDQPIELPELPRDARRRVIYFPGSTIGNFNPRQATRFLSRLARLANAGHEPEPGLLLIGVDVPKAPATLLAAYDDSAGVTAAFNLNLLERLNREADADFELDQFQHLALYNQPAHRVEMHLISRCAQRVTVLGETIQFDPGETIWTESSHKYPPELFAELADDWSLLETFTDAHERFHVHLMQA